MTGLIAPGCVSLQNVRPLLRFNCHYEFVMVKDYPYHVFSSFINVIPCHVPLVLALKWFDIASRACSQKDIALVSQTPVFGFFCVCVRFHLSNIRQSHKTVRMVTYSIYTDIWSLFYILVVVLHCFC